jgi:hypothetical protein
METTDFYVLVQGPARGDAQFYEEWLLAAAKAEAYWKEAYADEDFKQQVDHVCDSYIPDFGIAATIVITQLRGCRTTLLIELDSEEGDHFAMMAEMGFFAQRNALYQMTLPSSLILEKVKAAIFKFTKTEDDEFMLHPEYLVTAMPLSEATALQNRLRAIPRNDVTARSGIQRMQANRGASAHGTAGSDGSGQRTRGARPAMGEFTVVQEGEGWIVLEDGRRVGGSLRYPFPSREAAQRYVERELADEAEMMAGRVRTEREGQGDPRN